MNNFKDKNIAKVIIVAISVVLIILIVAVVLTIQARVSNPSTTPERMTEVERYAFAEKGLKNRLADTYMVNDISMISKQVEEYIYRNQDKERKKPYLYEINLIMKSNLYVGMDEDPKPGYIMYNSKSDCDGLESDVNFSISAYRSDGSLYCSD